MVVQLNNCRAEGALEEVVSLSMIPAGIQGLGAIQTGRVHEEVTAFSAHQILSSRLYFLPSTEFLILSQKNVLTKLSRLSFLVRRIQKSHLHHEQPHRRTGSHPLFVPPELPP